MQPRLKRERGVDHHLCGLLLKIIRVKDVCHNKRGETEATALSVSVSISPKWDHYVERH